ncbi:hypothetical protein LDL08_10940 [Nonomuraea glycinis]|uniref:Tetratricopeptide repeat protein n=1 Tax=Nonomuraea glycinis TaxID=2047744 RepID=A0A918A0X5_9ACTN|nr:hypothetical protein [Nonomuraea glycinis]MCA2176699.1 hypothetical protein [Nonomuraea glycinis]GGP03488.1 hypothetical protein GCM10012278_14910 [Nonomuraea glycinis]
MLCNLCLVLGGTGRFEEATRHLGLFGQAVQDYERALEIRDDIGDAATTRGPADARPVRQVRFHCRVSGVSDATWVSFCGLRT